MKKQRINVSRREFLVKSTALGTGFSLGMTLPLSGNAAAATGNIAEAGTASALSEPEVNAWVVI